MTFTIILAMAIAQSADGAAEKAKDIIAEITTFKLVEAVIIVLTTYFLIQVFSRLLFWLSERVAKEWRLRIKQFVPFVRMIVLSVALIVLMNRFLNLSKENVFAITGTVA
ncbi:MAG: mechanosensitive ion channel family protein, partial [Cyanobacteria bacterium P01_D01_bin.56]